MKRFIYHPAFLILASAILFSCKKDFLNVVPKGLQTAVTVDDYDMLMNSPDFYVNKYEGGWAAVVLMGDEAAAEESHFQTAQIVSQQAFMWAADIYQPTDIAFDVRDWLTNLYAANLIINGVMDATGGTEAQKKSIRAEALATRAWLYFQFVNYYGKPYVASTAGADLGFPIITTADITVTSFSRGTVQETYDFIIQDLKEAITDLPLTNSAGATRFSKAAAEGLLGKVHLFMGNNSDALTLFNAALADNSAQAVPARLYDYNIEFATGGKFFPVTENGPTNSPGLDYNDVTESLIAKSFYNGPYAGNGFENNFLVLKPQAQSLFDSSDLRLNFYAAQFPYNEPNPSGRLSKIGVQYTKYGLQLSELYLLLAECKARLNDLAGAIEAVETLRRNRMPEADAAVPSAVAMDQAALIKFIFDERVREFALEGYRWFDMRRMSVDPVFGSPIFTHPVFNTAGDSTVYTLNPERLTLRLPPYIINSNPDMPNNP